jgi:hypothetical protein
MASDASVCDLFVNQLAFALDSLENLIGFVLPSPESVSAADISGLFEEEK